MAILEHISHGYGDTVLLSVTLLTVVTCSCVCLVKSMLCSCGADTMSYALKYPLVSFIVLATIYLLMGAFNRFLIGAIYVLG